MNPFLPESVQSSLILASKSPRRIDILLGIGLQFRNEPAYLVLENSEVDCPPSELPVILAAMKAGEVAGRFPDHLVIGADTVVIVDGEVLEKPADEHRAADYLRKLSGRVHKVVTGLALRKEASGLEMTDKETTRVWFKDLTEAEINLYAASGEGKDKAGGYAIQGLGACLVRSIEGCYFNVVGLPVALLFDMLKKI